MSLSGEDKDQIRAMLREGIVDAAQRHRWLGPEDIVDDKGGANTGYIPTKSKVEEIAEARAQAAVDEYKKSLPKWYEFNRRPDTSSALVAVILFVAGAIYQVAAYNQGGLRNLFHWVVGTETKIRDVLKSDKEHWDTDQTFRAVTGGAFTDWVQGVSNVDNPIRALIVKTLDASPVLVFEGHTTFSLAEPVNKDCYKFNLQLANALTAPTLSPYDSTAPANDGNATRIDTAQIQKACINSAAAALDAPLDVPFFARVYKTESDGPADRIFAFLILKRTPTKSAYLLKKWAPHFDPAPETADLASADKPDGLCVTYTTQNPNFRIDGKRRQSFGLGEAMTEIGTGGTFWQINISEAIENHIGSTPPAFDLQQVLHSVNVQSITSDEDLAGKDACADVKPVKDEIVSARVLVFVNKDVDNH